MYQRHRPEPEPTVRVLMLKTEDGYPRPGQRTTYVAGEEYDIPESLAACFFSTCSADPAEAHQQLAPVQISDPVAAGSDEGDETAPKPVKSRPRVKNPARKG